jgi:putative acetyltransferase
MPPRAAVRLRIARDADGPAVAALVRRVLAEFGLPFDPTGIDRGLFTPGASARRAGHRFWVLESKGRIVGTAAVDRRGRGTCELKKMYLDRKHRGRGLGKRLLRAALAFARRAGYRRAILETHSRLTAALALYRRAGFRLLRRGRIPPRCDAVYALPLGRPGEKKRGRG